MKYLTTLTGPSCAGKSTLEAMMVERGCIKAISTTTRKPRATETDGVDYYFVTKETFRTMKDCAMFIESVEFGEHSYGVTTTELHRLFEKSDHVILVCEPNGAQQIRAYCAQTTDISLRQVFVDNPMSVIAERFLHRVVEDTIGAAVTNDTDRVKAIIHAHANRLAIMTSVEKDWVADAYGFYHPTFLGTGTGFCYDQVINRFDEVNSTQVADSLIRSTAVPA